MPICKKLECDRFDHSNILPPDLLEETLQTMALLLPPSDPKVKKWFQQIQAKQAPLIHGWLHRVASVRRHAKIKHFRSWRDRIIVLKEVYDEHEPRGILQLWRDDRRQIQRWAFWIAIAVFLLTLAQCVLRLVSRFTKPTLPQL